MASWFTRKVNIFMYVTEGYLSTLLILSAFHSFLGQIAPAMAIRSRDTEGGRTTRPPYPPPSNISWPFLPSFLLWQRSVRYHQQFRRNDAETFALFSAAAAALSSIRSLQKGVFEISKCDRESVARWILRVKADKSWLGREGLRCYSLALAVHRSQGLQHHLSQVC